MTPAFDTFLAPARRRPQIWRLVLGIVVIGAVYVGSVLLLMAVLIRLDGRDEGRAALARLVRGDAPRDTLVLLATFAGLVAGVMIAARLLQKRGPGTLLGRAPVVIRHFAAAAATVAAVYAVFLLPWSVSFDAVPNLPFATWAALLPLALAGIALQTLAEEITFRGYLMQQLAARFRQPWIWMGLPTVIFAALHWDPATNGPNTWAVMAPIGLFALAAADLTRRTGSLGAAWGMHFANNCLALLFLATGDTLTGLALWRTPYAAADPSLVWSLAGDVAALAVTWAILARRLGR